MAEAKQHILEWVTATGNRYTVPAKLDAQLETEPFQVDPKLGVGHLELDGERIGPDFEPGDALIVVNVRMLLAAKGELPGLPPPLPSRGHPTEV